MSLRPVRSLSYQTTLCYHFTVLTWPTALTVQWCGEETTVCDERVVVLQNNVNWSYIRVCVWTLLTVCSFIGHKRGNGFVI